MSAATPTTARDSLRCATIWMALLSATAKLDIPNLQQTGHVQVDNAMESLWHSLSFIYSDLLCGKKHPVSRHYFLEPYHCLFLVKHEVFKIENCFYIEVDYNIIFRRYEKVLKTHK